MKNKNDFLKQLGNNIRQRRKLKSFSQESFAKHIHVARRHYGFIEQGKVNISIVHLAKISLALDMSIDLLLPTNFSLDDLLDEKNE